MREPGYPGRRQRRPGREPGVIDALHFHQLEVE